MKMTAPCLVSFLKHADINCSTFTSARILFDGRSQVTTFLHNFYIWILPIVHRKNYYLASFLSILGGQEGKKWF